MKFVAGSQDGVVYATLSPDGKRIVTGSEDGKAWVWTIKDWPEMRASLWNRIQDNFTPEERIRYLSETPEEAEAAVANPGDAAELTPESDN